MRSLMFDTNALLRFLLKDIPQQANKVAQVIKKAKKDKTEIFIPQIVIFEINFALEKYYKVNKSEIIDKIESMMSASYFNIQDKEVFIEAIKLFKETNIDFVDCFLIIKSKEQEVELFTFDKKLKNILKQRIPKV